ncbi:ATP-binding protein [Paenactinomyces guangxiensis]|uniref:ATP-binding protein n=1 Tax=Paenactinomyces guangxiensis TaxID=1490290 RepID=A0A7W1WPE6_9BACL|nr:ATP-binding protein [Paenactinomyces guangxiensis]MBA4493658.1 ATP-binding protein [Paenactinomyces guangxiensis]MBH8590945.1 ATP-binding protein [Paenactinomyces guangxiensis]
MFPWNNVPKGSDQSLKMVAKVFFYTILFVASVVGVLALWVYLEKKFDSAQASKEASKAVDNTLSSIGDIFTLWLPIALIFIVVGVLLFYAGLWHFRTRFRKRAAAGVKYLRILPSNDIRLEIDKVNVLTRTFGGMHRPLQKWWKMGTPWFRLRFAIPADSQEIGIYMAYPEDKESSVKDTIRSAYPTAEIHDLTPDKFPEPEKEGSGGHFIMQLGRRKGLPLASLEQSKQSQLASILNCLRPGTYLDLQFAPVSRKKLQERSEDVLARLKRKKMKDMDPEEKARRVSLTQRLTGRELTFHVRLSLWSNHPNAVSVVRSTAESIETAMKYDGALYFWKHDWWNPLVDRNPVPFPFPLSIMTWTSDEIANLFHIPPGDHWIYKEPDKDEGDSRGYIVHLQANQRSLAADELNQGVVVGKLKHPLENREVRVDYKQMGKHFILTGASGMGKSSLSVEMIQSLLDEWFENPDEHPGFTIIDPAREIIPIIENRLRIAEKFGVNIPREKVHHFNLSDDSSHVPGLNLLHKIEGFSTNRIAQNAAMVLVTLADPNESLLRSKRLMGMAIQSLLEDNQPHTILGIEDLFRNQTFREKVIKNVQDPYVKRFWANIDEKEMKKDLEYVLHRIDRLLQNPTMRRLFCQKSMTLNIRKYMDEGHLVLIDTFGLKDYELRVTVGHLINQYHQTAKQRPAGAKFHLMMVDEAQMVQIPLLTEILSEDRKYAFGLGLITREINQFKNEDLLQAIRSNIGMILSCGQTEGSSKVEDLTRKSLNASFLERLPERNAAVYIRYKRKLRSNITTCVVENDPPFVYNPDGKIADHRNNEKEDAMIWGLEWGLEIMSNSPEARPVQEVDREIAEYMNQTLSSMQKSQA